MLESLINETQSLRLIRNKETGYMFIKPSYKDVISNCEIQDYNSKINPMTKFELKQYLYKLNLIQLPQEKIMNFNVDSQKFKNTVPFPYLKIENVLHEDFARKIQEEILNISNEEWDRYENPLEHKYTLRNKENLS